MVTDMFAYQWQFNFVMLSISDLLSYLWISGSIRDCLLYNRNGNTVGRNGPQPHAASRLQRVHPAVRCSPEEHRPGCVPPAHGGRWKHVWRHSSCLRWPCCYTGTVETLCSSSDKADILESFIIMDHSFGLFIQSTALNILNILMLKPW